MVISFLWLLAVVLVSRDEAYWKIFEMVTATIIIMFYVALFVLLFHVIRETNRIAATTPENNRELDQTNKAVNRKTYKITCHILITFGVSFIPFLIISALRKYLEEQSYFILIQPWAFLSTTLSSLVNPFIHTFRLKSMRNILKGLC